ncbi:MAG: acyl-CoA dehydrogenase family protein [Proteobacteria bacterium]|nr:acyl-CoA dehydrogenase family protein [Pseudomonadota bacterium]
MARTYKPVDFLNLDELLSNESKLLVKELRRTLHRLDARAVFAEAFKNNQFPRHIVGEIAKMDLFGMTLPAKYGGMDASYENYGVVCRELEAIDSGLRSFVSVQNSLVMFPIYNCGSEEQKMTYLPKLAKPGLEGGMIGCFGLTEPNHGSDPGSMETVAKKIKKGDQIPGSNEKAAGDGYILNGVKRWITNASIADLCIVWAKQEHDNNRVGGFIVLKDDPGLKRVEMENKLSLCASSTGELYFDNCFVPEERCMPNTQGLKSALQCLNKARYGIAWGGVGVAMDCFDEARQYAESRIQFDRPLSHNQIIQDSLVEMYTDITRNQAYVFHLAKLMDSGQAKHVHISIGKLTCLDDALKASLIARDMLGANGITLDYSPIRHMANLQSVITYEGTRNMHKLIIGEHLTGKAAFRG